MSYITNGDNGKDLLVLAHGAGAPMDSDFMNWIAHGVSENGIQVVRFEFPYMQERRLTGKKRPPDRQPVLMECWEKVIADCGGSQRIVIGGKSMGGRMASLIAARQQVRGLVCLGYPFHPQGKPEKLRTEHLANIVSPSLIVQGERDVFGNRQEVESYQLPENIQVNWVPDGDHDLKPRMKSGFTHEENIAKAVVALVAFIHGLG